MGDRDGKIEPLTINTIAGSTMPRHDAHTTELTPLHATITERGMSSGWPSVDIVFADAAGHGRRYVFTTSGRMLLMLAGAIQAVVVRNGHEPDYVPVLVTALQGTHPQAPSFDKALEDIAGMLRTKLAHWLGATSVHDGIVPGEDVVREALRATLLDVLRS